MKTKRSLYAAIGVATLLAAPNLFAAFSGVDGTLSFGASTFQNGNGGEFNAVTSGLGSFATFCLEHNSLIGVPAGGYTYTINSGSVSGGISGANAIDSSHTGLAMDNISYGTAWLYSQFRAGTLASLNGAGNYNDNHLANAGALQQAIWWLENETGFGVNNNYVTQAAAAVQAAGLGNDVYADSQGQWGVVALNLFGGPGADGDGLNQDQLGIVPEPSTVIAAALLLLPFGASTIRILRKNRMGQA